MSGVTAYLHFNGQCEEAFRLYEECMGAQLQMKMRYSESPMQERIPGMDDKLMHASLLIGDTPVMGADSPPGHYQKPQGFHVSFTAKNVDEAERVFGKLAEGGQVEMPLQQTFWTPRFGMVVDRYGIPWMVNCEHQTQQ